MFGIFSSFTSAEPFVAELEHNARMAKTALPILGKADTAILDALKSGAKKADLVIAISPRDDKLLPFLSSIRYGHPVLMWNGVEVEFDHAIDDGKLEVRARDQ